MRSFSLSHFASFAAEVERPHALAHQRDQLVVDDAHQRLAGRQALVELLADDLGAHRLDERLDDRQRHVGFEQRHAHLAQRVCDVLVGQAPAAAQAFDDALQALGQFVEHGRKKRVADGRERIV